MGPGSHENDEKSAPPGGVSPSHAPPPTPPEEPLSIPTSAAEGVLGWLRLLLRHAPQLALGVFVVLPLILVLSNVPRRGYSYSMWGRPDHPNASAAPQFDALSSLIEPLTQFKSWWLAPMLLLFVLMLAAFAWARWGDLPQELGRFPKLVRRSIVLGFAVWTTFFLGTYAEYSAPQSLSALDVRLESRVAFSGDSLPQMQFARLYSWMHGVEPDWEPKLTQDYRLNPKAGLGHVWNYYSRLVVYTLISLFLLVLLSIISNQSIVSRSPGRGRVTASLAVLLAVFAVMHALQWYLLMSAYGRLKLTADAFQQRDISQATRGSILDWPFSKLVVTSSGDDQEGKPETVLINFWPVVGKDSKFGFAVLCGVGAKPLDPPDRPSEILDAPGGLTKLRTTCEKVRSRCGTDVVFISDGQSQASCPY